MMPAAAVPDALTAGPPMNSRGGFVDPENPTQVAILMDVEDLDAVKAFVETEAAAAAMEHDGVLPETLVMLVEAKDLR
jgi:hypothetical protein